jgi:hypothetical protein
MNSYLILGALIVGVIIVFGASSIISATSKSAEVFKTVVKETNDRCDLCLQQFRNETICTHTSESKVCTAVRNYYCNLNCTIELK